MKRARRLGFATVAVLRAVRDGRRYGLDIVSHTELASGTVYPTLGRLGRRGFLTARWEDQRVAEREGRPRRRYYELTLEGSQALSEALTAYEALAEPTPSMSQG